MRSQAQTGRESESFSLTSRNWMEGPQGQEKRMKMKFAVIHRPSDAALSMIARRISDQTVRGALKNDGIESIGVCQGSVLEIIVAGDIAEKTADVTACELNGSCPQHMTCLVVLGKTSAVAAAMDAVAASR